MLTRLTRIQLAIFALVTVLAVGAISAFFLHLPAKLGIGTYKINAEFAVGGGIYPNANVTYRGVTIGRVEQVGLDQNGVVARMRLNSNTPVPDTNRRLLRSSGITAHCIANGSSSAASLTRGGRCRQTPSSSSGNTA